ncbi:acyl carrier protein [Micromonospora sp. DT53]|uniref:acyl carrier protein n=1 Tax=Micromonospora sp. DT53 TaxID=3393444 RepID=UPI003CE6F996
MAAMPTPDAVMDLIRRELIECAVEEPVTVDTRFDELEIDSLDAAEMMTAIKREFGVTLSRSSLTDSTLGQLVDLVVAGAAEPSTAS